MINKILETMQTILTCTVKVKLIQNMLEFLQVLKILANASVLQKNSNSVNTNTQTTENVCSILQLQKDILRHLKSSFYKKISLQNHTMTFSLFLHFSLANLIIKFGRVQNFQSTVFLQFSWKSVVEQYRNKKIKTLWKEKQPKLIRTYVLIVNKPVFSAGASNGHS